MSKTKDSVDQPVYLRLMEAIRQDVLSRNLQPGDQYATYAQLGRRFHVATGTVQKAMTRLAAMGAVAARPRRGTVIQSLAPLSSPIPSSEAEARAARSASTRLVGMIATDIASDHFYAEVIRGVQDALAGADYDLVIANSDEDPEKEAMATDRLLSKNLDGLIIDPALGNVERGYEHTRRILAGDLPVVLVDKSYRKLAADAVVSNNMEGAYHLTREILSRGHRRMAFITEPACSSVLDRCRGFRNATGEAGLPARASQVVGGELLYEESGAVHGRQLLEQPDSTRPTAIFCCNDRVARGVYEVCERLGLGVRRDISVVGYDGMPFAENMTPPLATVIQPRYEMGFEAGRLLIDRIDHGRATARTVVVKGRMILRESLGSAAADANASATMVAAPGERRTPRGNRLQRFATGALPGRPST